MIQTIEHGPVRELRLSRPPVNALSPDLIVALREAIEKAPADGARALVLSGSPHRFSGGLDVPLLLGLDRGAIAALWRDFYALLGAIACSSIPVVAAITGHAPAGGTVLALYCDRRFMADGDYKIGLNEVRVGIPVPPLILTAMRRLVGTSRAEYFAVTGELFSPHDALALGLLDELAPTDHVIERAIEWCNHLLTAPPEAMKGTRRLARADLVAIFESGLDAELAQVVAGWWAPETQATLRALAARLGKTTG